MTLSGEFVNIWLMRVTVWSVALAGLVIICSKECVKQSFKYDPVRWGISLLIAFTDFCLKTSLSLGSKFILMSPRRYHSWDLNTLVLMNGRSRKFKNRIYQKVYIRYQLEPVWVLFGIGQIVSGHILLFQVHYLKLCCKV